MEKIKCPICSSSNFKHFKNLKDRLEITNDIFLLVKCECDFVYLNPRPNQSEISKYYKHNQYHSHFSVNFLCCKFCMCTLFVCIVYRLYIILCITHKNQNKKMCERYPRKSLRF